MQKTNTHMDPAKDMALLTLIERSMLLTHEQKEQVRAFVEGADQKQRDELLSLLQTEMTVVQTMVSDSVRNAASHGNSSTVVQKLDDFFRRAGRSLSQSEERVERDTEAASAESLLDAA